MENLKLATRPFAGDPTITVLALEGTCNHETADSFDAAIKQLLSEKKARIILDLEKLTYISSRGLGTLMNSIKQARDLKGDIVLMRVTPGVASIFDLLDIPQLFRIFKNEAEAYNVFQDGAPKPPRKES
jgi:anti-sigma B factor antagonist